MLASMPPAWRPVDDDALRARALDAAREIAREVVAAPPEKVADLAESALFLAYLAQAGAGDEAHADVAVAHIERALERLAGSEQPPALHRGFAGVAWIVQHLRATLLDGDDGDLGLDDIDETVLELVTHPQAASGKYDLISGLVGFGVYALERLPSAAAAATLTAIVDILERRARTEPDGVTWWTPPEHLPPHQRELHPEGHVDLGLAHGVPGVIAFLARVARSGVAGERARALLVPASAWLRARRQPDAVGSRYPSWFVPGEAPAWSRPAWCYGDAGVAAALSLAARALGDADGAREAAAMLAGAGGWDPARIRVVDTGLCHGSAGLAQICLRLGNEHDDPRLRAAASTWTRHVLDMRRDGEAIAGFPALLELETGVAWRPAHGLLVGAAGVGLTLLAAATTWPPGWDRALLLSG
jgi:lantibiotic modifying enzyme